MITLNVLGAIQWLAMFWAVYLALWLSTLIYFKHFRPRLILWFVKWSYRRHMKRLIRELEQG